jgi:hypothetical protein
MLDSCTHEERRGNDDLCDNQCIAKSSAAGSFSGELARTLRAERVALISNNLQGRPQAGRHCRDKGNGNAEPQSADVETDVINAGEY